DVRERGAGGERERQRPPGDAPVEREQKPEQADERGGEQDRAGRVEPAQLPTERRSRPRRVGRQDAGGKRERERDQRQVDDEDRPPALPADEVAAERRPDRGGDGGEDREHAERACLPLPDRAAQDAEPGRIEGGAAGRLDDAYGDQRSEAGRERGGDAGEADKREPGEEDALAPVQVGEPARERLTDGACEVVGGDQPGGGREVEPEVAGEVDERDRDHRRVERVQQRPRGDRREQAQPRPPARLGGGGDGGGRGAVRGRHDYDRRPPRRGRGRRPAAPSPRPAAAPAAAPRAAPRGSSRSGSRRPAAAGGRRSRAGA